MRYEQGEDRISAAINGTLEVLPAVFSAILTTIVAFSLFFMLDGMLGDFFPEMGFVVIGTLIFSLIEGVLILPTHIAHSKALKGIQTTSKLKKVIEGDPTFNYRNKMEFSFSNSRWITNDEIKTINNANIIIIPKSITGLMSDITSDTKATIVVRNV